ncbi:acyl-CoA thioesterase II, partial [Paenarthrobacter sp. RAF9]
MTETNAGLDVQAPAEDPMDVLIGLLDLGDFDGARTNEDIFLGPSQKQPRH